MQGIKTHFKEYEEMPNEVHSFNIENFILNFPPVFQQNDPHFMILKVQRKSAMSLMRFLSISDVGMKWHL